THRAGGFAMERYRKRHWAWLRRVWWAFPLVVMGPVVAGGVIALTLHARHLEFLWGVGIGAGAAAVVVLADSPPAHIARWRMGAEGEAATAKALRVLLRDNWALINDIPTAFGNID